MDDPGNYIRYSLVSETESSVSYMLFTVENEFVGNIYGCVGTKGEFVSDVKIWPKYQHQGLGYLSFKQVFDELNSKVLISSIIGSWHKDREFSDFEDGMSSNLLVYLKCCANGDDKINCAFNTPTGKWAKKLGFNTCSILSETSCSVVVRFEKSNPS